MIIGIFNQEGDGYTGSIYGIGIACPDVTFSPVPAKLGSGPDFVVIASPSADDIGEFEIGAAWAKTSKKGKAYLSVKLDGPALAEPINGALIEQPSGAHALVWNRKDAKADDLTAEAEAAA